MGVSKAKRQPVLQVTVVDDAASPKCEARCGLDFSSPDTLESTADVLRKLFRGRVKLEYAGLGGVQADIAERVKSGELSLPLLLVNGKPRISGYFDLHSLQEVIQAEIEMAAS